MIFCFFIIYDIVVSVLIVLYLPIYIGKRKINPAAWLEKLSCVFLPRSFSKPAIWIQAVSVGEVLAIRKLVNKLKSSRPDLRIVISTTTLTGRAVANKLYGVTRAEVIFFPFDISFVLVRVIKRIRPVVFVAIETELWPNLFYRLKLRNVPIVILNARISDKAYNRYKKIKFFTGKILAMCSCIGAQNDFYRARFLSLGARDSRTILSGNMKFDSLEADPLKVEGLRRRYAPRLKPNGSMLLIAASTHNPEERIVLDIYKGLMEDFNLRLLIAPRHPQRVKEIAKEIISFGFQPVIISKLKQPCSKPAYRQGRSALEQVLNNPVTVDKFGKKIVFILDTVGELFYFYSLGDICFVGGSLVNYGGHNILEPMYFAKPTLFGPYMSNFLDIKEAAIRHQAAIGVKDKQDLKNNIINLLNNHQLCRKLSENCLSIFSRQHNILENNGDVVLRFARR